MSTEDRRPSRIARRVAALAGALALAAATIVTAATAGAEAGSGPTASPTVAPLPNSNGWIASAAVITWNWSDPDGLGSDCVTSTPVESSSGTNNIPSHCVDTARQSNRHRFHRQHRHRQPDLPPPQWPRARQLVQPGRHLRLDLLRIQPLASIRTRATRPRRCAPKARRPSPARATTLPATPELRRRRCGSTKRHR